GHARSPKVKPLHATLARRALLRLDSMAAPDPHSLGVPRPQFPRLCPACLPRYSLQTIFIRVLISLSYFVEDGLLLSVGFLGATILIGLGSAAVWGTVIGATLISG